MTAISQDFIDQLVPRRGRGDDSLCFWATGLGEEAGEVMGQCKKLVRDHEAPNPIATERDAKIISEAGDVLFYLQQVLAKRGYSLEDAAIVIVNKLGAIGPPLGFDGDPVG